MAIRDCSDLPDDQVPEWVREKRERARYLRSPEHRAFMESEHLRLFGVPRRSEPKEES